jgi:hypothetical protein
MNNLMIHLLAQERRSICEALAKGEALADNTPSLRLNVALGGWLRAEITGADLLVRTRALNHVITVAKEITG